MSVRGYRALQRRTRGLSDAVEELLSREFDWSVGHLTALLNGCVFAPSLLTFWLVNGVLDFSTAFLLGTVSSPGGLVVRVVAYVLLVPTFLLLRMAYYLGHPTHRRSVLSGGCPSSDALSLDWFSVGILATGLPLALQTLGPWIGSNLVFLVGLFVLPRFVASDRIQLILKTTSLIGGSAVFLYASYGAVAAEMLPLLPPPASTLGWVATLTLGDATVGRLLAVTNSLLTGPVVVAAVALLSNRVLTRPELTSIPLVRYSLPARDPARRVLTSAALGTLFYLGVVAVWTGRVAVLP